MPALGAAAVIAALAVLSTPEKQALGSPLVPEVRADFLPRSALVEVDGQALGRGFVVLKVPDPKRTYRIRVSAEGFEPEEKLVEAERIVDRQFFLVLRPLGVEKRLDAGDAAGLARAASRLWKAGLVDDAADYAEQSLQAGNNSLAHRVLGEVWRRRGDRDRAVKHFTMYLSLADDPPDGPEIRAWLMQPRPGDITIPAR
jgi:hypothetical protein